MKNRVLIFMFCLLFHATIKAQDQALYLEKPGSSVTFKLPENMPFGTESRTIEFWIKFELPDHDYNIYQEIFHYGDKGNLNGNQGNLFTIKATGDKDTKHWRISFPKQGYAITPYTLSSLPTSKWNLASNKWYHFALVFDTAEPDFLFFYINGEGKKVSHKQSVSKDLNTLKAEYGRIGYSHRADEIYGDSKAGFTIDNLAVWGEARTEAQIQQDMILHYGDMSKLVVYFDFNEGEGTTFNSKLPLQMPLNSNTPNSSLREVSGTVVEGVRWTKPISQNPSMKNPGTWFVIQNKSDIDTDTKLPPRNFALQAEMIGDSRLIKLSYSQFPLTGDYSEFLWRIEWTNDNKTYLINKKHGRLDNWTTNSGSGISASCSIELAAKEKYGTNAFTISPVYLSLEEYLSLGNGKEIGLKDARDQTDQVWLFQPMEVVGGYHIPRTAEQIKSVSPKTGIRNLLPITSIPFTRTLQLANNLKSLYTNTSSEWAILNMHLIANNMMNAIRSDKQMVEAVRNTDPEWRKELNLFSKYDHYYGEYDYPLVTQSSAHFMKYRGFATSIATEHKYWDTYISESITGNILEKDLSHREFDHITHEFGHAISNGWDGGQYSCPTNGFSDFWREVPHEVFAIAVQAWFNNNNSYEIFGFTREELKTNNYEQYEYISGVFNEENTWMPPRIFRPKRLEKSYPTKIASGTILWEPLQEGPVLQSEPGLNFLLINGDGNTHIKGARTEYGGWHSSQDFGIPHKNLPHEPGPREVKFHQGQLLHIFEDRMYVLAGTEEPFTQEDTWLILHHNEDNEGARLAVINEKGEIIWEQENTSGQANEIAIPTFQSKYDITDVITHPYGEPLVISGPRLKKIIMGKPEPAILPKISNVDPSFYIKRLDFNEENYVWFIDDQDELFYANITIPYVDKQKRSGKEIYYNKVDGGKLDGATDLGYHTKRSIWAITKTPADPERAGGIDLSEGDGNFTIVHIEGAYNGYREKFTINENITGGAIAIDVENDKIGTPWVITAQGTVYRYRADETPGKNLWSKIELPEGLNPIDISEGSGGHKKDMFLLGADGFVYRCYKNDKGDWDVTKASNESVDGTSLAITSPHNSLTRARIVNDIGEIVSVEVRN